MVKKETRVYLVIGTGDSSANVIETGLSDIPENAHIVIAFEGKPTDGQARVIDWVIDHNREFTIVHNGVKLHPAIAKAASEVITQPDVYETALNLYPNYTTLLLWEQDETGVPTMLIEDLVFRAVKYSFQVLDLTNGLVPITVEEPAPSVAPKASRKPQDASNTPTPRETAPQPKSALKTAPNESYVLVVVGTEDKPITVTGDSEDIIKFLTNRLRS